MLKVERATEQDITAWLDLADEVGALFGADMAHDPTFEEWLKRNIDRGTAFCIRVDGDFACAMQFRNGWINWLAVRRQFWRQGLGRALVEFAQASGAREVRVTTFGKDHPHPDSVPGRALYLALGFEPSGETPEAVADGTSREILIWRT